MFPTHSGRTHLILNLPDRIRINLRRGRFLLNHFDGAFLPLELLDQLAHGRKVKIAKEPMQLLL